MSRELGTSVADGAVVAIDADRLVGSHVGIVAQAGAGKSYTLRKFLEVTHGALQHIVLDSEDEFYTLRERFDYVIAGGENGDFPATVANAPQIARALLENGLSAVVQMNALGREGARAFVAKFLATVIDAPASLWHPTMIVLDEADRFAPLGERSASSEAVIDYVSKGRKRGFGMALATQRLSKISRDATGDVHNWLFGRVGQGTDRRRVADELGFSPTSEEGRGLMSLRQGEFWIRGPALAPVPSLVKVGQVKTSHVRPGQGRVPTTPPAGKMKAIVAALAAAAQPLKDEESVPVPTASKAAVAPDSKALAAAEQRGYERGLAEGQRIGEARGLAMARAALDAVELDGPPSVAPVTAPAPKTAQPRQMPRTLPVPSSDIGAERRPLAILAAAYPAGMTEAQWAVAAGMKRTGGTWTTYRSRLKVAGRIELREGQWFPTEKGLGDAGQSVEPMPAPGPALVAFWAERISGVGPMLRALASRYPKWTTKESLASGLSMAPSGGTFGTYLSRLRSAGLLDVDNARQVRLTRALMERAEAA